MQVRRESEEVFLICLQSGELLRQSLEQACLDLEIVGAAVSGIGGLCEVELGYWRSPDYERKSLDGNWEMLTLLGNISLYEGRPFAHLHVSLAGPDLQVVGGHFFEGRVTATAEIFLTRTTPIVRHWDDRIGAALWTF
ncbi:hypothetical protein ABS71_01785 [bacterium SCN 62-11]|nr:DNA-binding protein [Candidatus Eremiobacteraeota bacterium]ODT78483.1 MAG: hypothetical protein ABS71_01785 [bacterium SCN 62-11]